MLFCGLIELYGDCLFKPVKVGSVGSVLFMPAVVTSVDSELVCEIETPVGDQSTTELPTLVTVNYIQYKFSVLYINYY